MRHTKNVKEITLPLLQITLPLLIIIYGFCCELFLIKCLQMKLNNDI